MAHLPWLRTAFDRRPGWPRALPLAALAVTLVAFDDLGVRRQFPRCLVTYTFWAYLGLYYRGWKGAPLAPHGDRLGRRRGRTWCSGD